MNAAEDDPRDRESEDLPVHACVEAGLQPIVDVVLEVHPSRADEDEQTRQHGDHPAEGNVHLWESEWIRKTYREDDKFGKLESSSKTTSPRVIIYAESSRGNSLAAAR